MNEKKNLPSARANRRTASFNSFLTLILALFILGMINYLGAKYFSHKDLSRAQFYALSEKTKEVVAKLDAPLTITTLFSTPQSSDYDRKQLVTELLKEYQRLNGNLVKVENIDPAYDIAQATELKKRLEFDANANLIVLEYKKQAKIISADDLVTTDPVTGASGGFKGEQVITSAISTILEGKSARIYFTTGHLEHDILGEGRNGANWIGSYLKRNGIEIQKVDLASQGDVPPDADALVILGPNASFSNLEVDALNRYLSRNGQLLILLDPYVNSGLEATLQKYGITYDSDIILYAAPTPGGMITLPLALVTGTGLSSSHELTAKMAGAGVDFKFENMRSLSISNDEKGQPNTKVTALMTTINKCWGAIKPLPSASTAEELIPKIKDIQFNPKTDLAGPLKIALAYDAGSPLTTADGANPPLHGTRIVAIGGAQFMSNAVSDPLGGDFFANALDWMVKKNPVLNINPKSPQEYPLSVTPMQFWTLGAFAAIIIPGIPLVAGLFTWISRLK